MTVLILSNLPAELIDISAAMLAPVQVFIWKSIVITSSSAQSLSNSRTWLLLLFLSLTSLWTSAVDYFAKPYVDDRLHKWPCHNKASTVPFLSKSQSSNSHTLVPFGSLSFFLFLWHVMWKQSTQASFSYLSLKSCTSSLSEHLHNKSENQN